MIPVLQAPSPWVPGSCAGGSWLKPVVGDFRRDSPFHFSPPSDSCSSGPITLGSWLMCGVPGSNLWLATLVVTRRFSFLPPSHFSSSGPITQGSWLMCGFLAQTCGWRLSSRLTVSFFTPLVIPVLQAPSPWVPGSCAGVLAQTCGWRLSSRLTVSFFTP